MPEVKAAEKPEDAATEAKGMAEQFVQTLGLVDLIIGALILYWMRLWFGTKLGAILPSSGYPWLDIALLACAAAFVGKVVSLLANLAAAFRDQLRNKTKGDYKRLVDALSSFRTELVETSNIEGADQVDVATAYAISGRPSLKPELDNIYNATTLAYSMTLLSFLFGIYFWTKRVELDFGSWVVLVSAQGVLAISFLIYGLLSQTDYIDALTDNLNFMTAKLKQDKEGLRAQKQGEDAAENKPIAISLSQVPRIAVDLSASNVSVEVVRVTRQKEGS
jgi:hypothetical protein